MRGVCRTGSRSWTGGGLLKGGLPHSVRKEEAHPRPPLPPWPHPSILFPQKLPCHCWTFRQRLSLSRWHDVIAARVHSVAAQPLPPRCIAASPTNVLLSNSLLVMVKGPVVGKTLLAYFSLLAHLVFLALYARCTFYTIETFGTFGK